MSLARYSSGVMAITKSRIEKNLRRITENIESACRRVGRSPKEVSLVGVTKSVGMPAIKGLLDVGVLDLGESRAQELSQRGAELRMHLQRRRNQLRGPVRWHMVGHVQRNKVRLVLEVADVIHSVDSLRLAEAIDDRADRMERNVDVFLQVNCSEEPQKFGVPVGAAAHLGELISTMRNLRLVGLMTMGPLVDDPEKARPTFTRLCELFVDMRKDKIGGDAFRDLSMGMSQDYVVAVEEGATILRIGTALFE